MIKLKHGKNGKNKLVFYSKNDLNFRVEILKEENSYKNIQRINFNQKQKFTIKKKFTLDWHTRPNSNLMSGYISKNQKILKLASFYSQLNSTNQSKKFTSLMILNLKNEIHHFKDVKQHYETPDRIKKPQNSLELEKNHQIFTNFQSKVWFSKMFMPFSNRSYWWVLLPTRGILTHMCWNNYFKRIKKIFSIPQNATSSKEYFSSTILFDSFPEFLIEKPIYWYWMLPFFGCIGLISNNLNFSFFGNSYSTYNFQNKVDLNLYSTFSQYQIQNSISWEMFQFFDYKKILFDSSFKYLNKVSLNNDILLLQIKKAWLSRQKEQYLCNYQDNFIQENLNQNLNQISQIATLNWWKRNWEGVTYQKSKGNFMAFSNAILSNPKQKNSLLDSFNCMYSFDSLFYSRFYWYWHTLDTKNIDNFFNFNYSNLSYKKDFQDLHKKDVQKILTNYNSTVYPPKPKYNELVSPSNSFVSINEFPLKIQLPWIFDNTFNCMCSNPQKNHTYNGMSLVEKKKIDNDLKNIAINVHSQNKNNKNYSKTKSIIEFEIKKINFKFKTILDYNFLQNRNPTTLKEFFIPSLFSNLKKPTKSSFIFCISSKNQSIRKKNELVKQNLQLIKHSFNRICPLILNEKNTNFINDIKLQNKQRLFLKLNLYTGIGCEIFESELNPIYGRTKIEFNNLKKNYKDTPHDHSYTHTMERAITHNLKRNLSISSFHKASLLLDNFLSKFYFESGLSCLTTQYLINYFYKILNLNKQDNNHSSIVYATLNYEKIIQIKKNPIVMSGYNLPHLNSIFQGKKKIIKNRSNPNLFNQIHCILPPNINSNQLKLNNFLNYNQTQQLKIKFHKPLTNIRASSLSLITKQNLCIINKKVGRIDSKSKKFGRFVILNLLKSSQNEFFKSSKLQINIKKMQYRKKFFNIKTNWKYQTIRPLFLNNIHTLYVPQTIECVQNDIIKMKENKMKRNITNNNFRATSLLLGYSDSIIKEKINSILRESFFSDKPERTLVSSSIFSNSKLTLIKRKPKTNQTFLNFNNFPKYVYVSNKSIFWNYINSTYNSSGLLNTNKPFIFDKFNEFIKNIRMNIGSRNNKNFKNSSYFSNLLLQKYQRKGKNWPAGADPQGFFYKRINKLNFKQIHKKQNIDRNDIQNEKDIGKVFNFQSNIFKKLKNVSASKPVGELLWEVRTKHKTPEVLLIQQTLFFQKKLVRKSTEENNFTNQSSPVDGGLSQKLQTLLRKMTQRRSYRKHVFLETLFNWTRDAISLRKMLRKIYFKNNWQIPLKYILKSKNSVILSDSYTNWYKKNFYNTRNKQRFLFDSFKTTLNVNSQKIIKTENIRPFFYKFIQTKNNNKLFQSKSNIDFVLNNYYIHTLYADFNLFKSLINCYELDFKDKKRIYNKHTDNSTHPSSSFLIDKEISNISNHPLVFPEWKLFNSFTLPNVLIKTQSQKLIETKDDSNSKSTLINYDSINPLSLISINRINNNQDYLLNVFNSSNLMNQRNFSKIGFPLYNSPNNALFQSGNTNNINSIVNKKLNNDSLNCTNSIERVPSSVPLSFSFNNNILNKSKNSHYDTELKSKQVNSFLNFNLSNILNPYLYYKSLEYKKYNKLFGIKHNYNYFNFLQTKLKSVGKSKLNFSSNQLSLRNRLFYQKLYFTNLFWHSTDFVLNTNSTIFSENQIIKNVIKQNWVFQTRPIYSQNFYDKELNLNLNNLLATLSTWQSKFQIKRDLILQIFYMYLDHAGAFLNYIIKNLILDNVVNQIQNWNLFTQITVPKESIKQHKQLNEYKLEKDFIIQPTWSFDLLNHIKIQYPHLYNQIQLRNQSNFNNIQGFSALIKTPELESKSDVIFSPNYKTQVPFIHSFRINSGKNVAFLKSYNMFTNIYTNPINIKLQDQSIINKLSSQSLILRNSTLFCHKWIQNRQLYNLYKIEFLRKQQKFRQILNIIKFKDDQIKQNYIKTFYTKKVNLNSKETYSLEKKIISFKRRSGFLFTRSLITRNFNSFSSFSKVTKTEIDVYLNSNLEKISIRNFIFLSQLLLLHICLIFCLITVYQSAFHFCLKSFISIFVILIHYFLNIKYRFKRLIKYVYQNTAQSFIRNIREYFDSLNYKLFVFVNTFSTRIFSNNFSTWGKIYNSALPSLTHFLFKNPFIKSKNRVNTKQLIQLYVLETSKRKKLHNFQSFFDNIELNGMRNKFDLNLKFDLISKRNLLKIINKKKENNRMSLLRNENVIQKSDFGKLQNDVVLISNKLVIDSFNGLCPVIPWEKQGHVQLNEDVLKKVTQNEELMKKKDSSIFKLSFKLLKWNLGFIFLIGESDIFAELEPYREMHWYFLKRLPIFLRSNTSSEDPINMYDYQADEKLRKFKEQFKKSTEIFQKRQNTIERKTERNRKKEHLDGFGRNKSLNNSEISNLELINKKYSNNKNPFKKQKQTNSDTHSIICVIKSDRQLKEKSILIPLYQFYGISLNNIKYFFNNLHLLRKKISRGQPFWKPFFSFLAYTLFVSRLAKLNRRFRDSVLIINYVWIPFGPLTAIFSSFLWKNWVLNFSTFLNNPNSLLIKKLQTSTTHIQLNKTRTMYESSYNLNKLNSSEILQSQYKFNQNNNLNSFNRLGYCSPFQAIPFLPNQINSFEANQFAYEIQTIWENLNVQNNGFSQFSPPLLNRVFLWNFVKFEKKYKRAILKWSNKEKNIKNQFNMDFLKVSFNNENQIIDENIMNRYKYLYINNQEQSAQNRYIHYQTYDPKVRLYRFYTNFSKNLHDIGIIQDAKNVHPIFGSLMCEIYSGLLSSATKSRTQLSGPYKKNFPRQFFSSTKNILLVGNTNASNFVLLVQAFAAETGLKLFMEDAKRLRRLGRRGINKSTKRLEKLFEIAQAHSPCIVFLEDIDVIGSKRRVIKINEEEEDEDMAIRSFFSKLIYRKQHNYKSLRQSFIHQNLFISNDESYRNTQKSIIPESPIPSNLIEYQLTRRKAFSNYFSNTSNSSYQTFITKFNALKKLSSINGNFSGNVSSSPTNTVIIWKLLKSKLVTPKKTIKETPWKHIPVDSMRSIPLITYSIRVKVAKLTMLAIYTMNTQLRLVKDLIKLLEKMQYESYKGFIVFATTNKLAILDPSLRRPGRFDETVYLPSLTVNPNYRRFSAIHFLNVLSVDSKDFVNFSRTFNLLNSMNFAIDWNLNTVYGNVFIQDNSDKVFYPTKTSLRDLINSTADNVYNQNIFMQNENNIYQKFIPFDIWGNIGFQKPSFSIYSKSALLLSLAYSKAGQLIIKLLFQEQEKDHQDTHTHSIEFVNNQKKLFNKRAFNSENNELTIWPNSNNFTQFKKINISYTSRNKYIKNYLIHYFGAKIGEFCFFSFYNNNNQNNTIDFQNTRSIEFVNKDKKKKINHLFEKNAFGLRCLYGIQPNWKNTNSIIFSLIRTSCLYSKNHLTSKLFYLDDVFKKRQRIFSENLGPCLLFEYFNLNTESFLHRNTIPLEEHLQKQQNQKYLLNLQQKPLRKFLFDSTSIKTSKNDSYLNKIYNQNIISSQTNKTHKKNSLRLALFRILFNELGSLDLITLRPTAMNYYYDKKISNKQRFRKYTYKWWNWHLKKTIDSLEEFQYLDFFPYADKQYNPRRQRWMLTNGYSAYWLAQEKILYYQIYEQLIIECFQISYLKLDRHREMLDYLVQLLMTKQLLTEIQWILFFKRFM